MGVCLSCLGQANSQSDPSETEGLLHEEPYRTQYGAINQDPALVPPQIDPEELERERDALERLCAATSERLIDISHVTPTEPQASSEPRAPTEPREPTELHTTTELQAEAAAEPQVLPKLPVDFSRLYAREFGIVNEAGFSRPSTSNTLDGDGDSWLKDIVDEEHEEALDTVKPFKGHLIMSLDNVFGSNAPATAQKRT